jgi:hypothetical protein
MKFSYATVVLILLSATPGANAEPPVKEVGVVSWQYYSGKNTIGDPLPAAGTKANIRCSVISSDGDGDWVCLYVEPVPKSKLPDSKSANACRPIGKDGKAFKLNNLALLPDSDTAQVVSFVSGEAETTYKLLVKQDGTISFEVLGPTFVGDTSMSGAVSMCWYVARKK